MFFLEFGYIWDIEFLREQNSYLSNIEGGHSNELLLFSLKTSSTKKSTTAELELRVFAPVCFHF